MVSPRYQSVAVYVQHMLKEVGAGANSKMGFHNPRAIELVNAAMGETNPLTLDSIYRELAPIVQEEQPFTFLTFGVEAYAVHRRVKGQFSVPSQPALGSRIPLDR